MTVTDRDSGSGSDSTFSSAISAAVYSALRSC